jgi:hypothetical protein
MEISVCLALKRGKNVPLHGQQRNRACRKLWPSTPDAVRQVPVFAHSILGMQGVAHAFQGLLRLGNRRIVIETC